MNVYSILVHPNNNSLNGALLSAANEFFTSQGHQVTTLNLFSIQDELSNAAKSLYYSSNAHTDGSKYLLNWAAGNGITDFIKEETQRVKSADLMFVQSPIWVYSMPALFKSYMEQVFLINEFFSLDETDSEDQFKITHLTQNKKILLSLTLGGTKGMVSHVMSGAPELTYLNLKNVFENFIGYEFLNPHITWGTTTTDVEKHKRYIPDLQIHLANTFS